MTQEHKDLLIKDLCARLPYGVKVFYEYVDSLNKKTYGYSLTLNTWCIDEMKAEKAVVKPYLRPMSSMTEEQRKEYESIIYSSIELHSERYYDVIDVDEFDVLMDFYHKHHIDYRGLIPMNLAIDCTNLNIY